VGESCTTALAPPIFQQAVESQLREAGFPVAKVHNAILTSNIECAPGTAKTKAKALPGRITINQCAVLSQVVSRSAEIRGALTTTWRECQSYTCAGAGCGAMALSAARTLVDAFVADHRARAATEVAAVATAVAAVDSASIPAAADPLRSNIRLLFYCIYIVICIAVLFRWEWVKHVR